MKKLFVLLLLFISPAFTAVGEIFNTSKCFDLLCAPQYIDQLREDASFSELCSDSPILQILTRDVAHRSSAICMLNSTEIKMIFHNVCSPFNI